MKYGGLTCTIGRIKLLQGSNFAELADVIFGRVVELCTWVRVCSADNIFPPPLRKRANSLHAYSGVEQLVAGPSFASNEIFLSQGEAIIPVDLLVWKWLDSKTEANRSSFGIISLGILSCGS